MLYGEIVAACCGEAYESYEWSKYREVDFTDTTTVLEKVEVAWVIRNAYPTCVSQDR
jgi:hypothetical protein